MPTEKQTRKQAIKAKCLDCSGGIRAEIRRCPVTNCPLWPFRMGAEIKGTGEDEATEDLDEGEAAADI